MTGTVPEWPADQVEHRELHTLTPYANNPRTHTPEQVELIADSIKRWGWTMPVLIDEDGQIIAGHGRVMAASLLELPGVPCVVAEGWSDEKKRAYVIADNQLTLAGGWDKQLLEMEVRELDALDVDLSTLGFTTKALDAMLGTAQTRREELDAEDAHLADVDTEAPVVSRDGDVWRLGPHRVAVGDATDPATIAELFDDNLADMVHADPPYGMGKESAGVANDNLYREQLDAFQVQWLRVALAHAVEATSVYVWGQAPDLWRLWWTKVVPQLGAEVTHRNEIVWAKGSAFGVTGAGEHSYPTETERCLFFMRGQQFLGNQNKADYWEGYDPLRLWLCAQRDAMGWTAKAINELTGTNMAGHWFGKSQFAVIARRHYDTLRDAALGVAFVPTYDELLAQFADSTGEDYRRELSEAMRAGRSYFDNTHDAMTDVWQFPRVRGAERFGHATPKPVAMMARGIASSCPKGGLVYEPFAGTGSTLLAADMTGRRCFTVDLEPRYVDVVVRRWQNRTGDRAILDAQGCTFDDVAASR